MDIDVRPSTLAKERLPRMSALLRRDAENPTGVKFDLGTWAEPADNSVCVVKAWSTEAGFKVPLDCGTKACAFGLAAISGEFAAEGLTYNIGNGSTMPTGTLTPFLDRTGDGDLQRNPTHFRAAEELFGISHDDARYFFDPDCYSGVPREAEGEIMVADRIDAFLNGSVDANYHPAHSYNDEDDYDDQDDED